MAAERVTTVRLTAKQYAAAQLVASVTHRSVAGLIQHALVLYIEKNYPKALEPGATVILSLSEAPAERSEEAS